MNQSLVKLVEILYFQRFTLSYIDNQKSIVVFIFQNSKNKASFKRLMKVKIDKGQLLLALMTTGVLRFIDGYVGSGMAVIKYQHHSQAIVKTNTIAIDTRHKPNSKMGKNKTHIFPSLYYT